MTAATPPSAAVPAARGNWLALVFTLPREEAAGRMRVLRTLETLGAATLSEGVYLVPDAPTRRQGMQRLVGYVRQLRGTAHVLSIVENDDAQAAAFRLLFDRSHHYVDLIKTVESLRAGFGVSEPAAIARVLAKLRRDFDAIAALDFFPSALKAEALDTLARVDADVRRLMFAPERPAARLAEGEFFRRTWASRVPVFADRLASAWLIRRFIDPEATVLWLEKGVGCPASALGFAFEGATFRAADGRVAFEDLLARFSLDGNQALARIGRLVYAIESGSEKIAEAGSVENLLSGAQRRSANTTQLLAESEKTFDLLYDTYCQSDGTRARR